MGNLKTSPKGVVAAPGAQVRIWKDILNMRRLDLCGELVRKVKSEEGIEGYLVETWVVRDVAGEYFERQILVHAEGARVVEPEEVANA